MKGKWNWIVLLAISFGILFGCGGDSPEEARKKLERIVTDDLEFMKKEIPAAEVSDSARYKIVIFKKIPAGTKISYTAETEFYYFKNVQMKQIRKYRYVGNQGIWERTSKEYQSY